MATPKPHTYGLFMQPPRLSRVCRTAAQDAPEGTETLTQTGDGVSHSAAQRHAISEELGRNSVAATGSDSVASWSRS